MSSINDLPPEMICELFRHLSPKDLIVCSMVNKLWQSLFSGFKIHRMAAITEDFRIGINHNLTKWSYPDRRFEEQELCEREVIFRLFDRPLLTNLQHLALSGIWSNLHAHRIIALLNGSSHLVHLEMNVDFFSKVKLHLKLPRLRVLAFHMENVHFSLSFDCPELSVLLYRDHRLQNLLEVKHPETIRILETNMFGEKLTPFKGVECFVVDDFQEVSRNSRSILSLPRLKELHYNERISKALGRRSFNTMDEMKLRLREFLDEVHELKGPEFKFRFAGFQLTPRTKWMLDQIDFGVQDRQRNQLPSDDYVYMRNYHLIGPDGALGFIRSVNYSALMGNVTGGELPSCFFRKFTGIQSVHVSGRIQNMDHFLRFLRSLSLLRCLTLRHSCLVQEFYDQLPASAPYLETLLLYRPVADRKKQQIKFGFMAQFPRLMRLEIEIVLSFDSLASLINSLKRLKKLKEDYFSLTVKGAEMYLNKREGSKVCKVLWNSETVLNTENPDELLNFFQNLVRLQIVIL